MLAARRNISRGVAYAVRAKARDNAATSALQPLPRTRAGGINQRDKGLPHVTGHRDGKALTRTQSAVMQIDGLVRPSAATWSFGMPQRPQRVRGRGSLARLRGANKEVVFATTVDQRAARRHDDPQCAPLCRLRPRRDAGVEASRTEGRSGSNGWEAAAPGPNRPSVARPAACESPTPSSLNASP
jgi:hypothetical protein